MGSLDHLSGFPLRQEVFEPNNKTMQNNKPVLTLASVSGGKDSSAMLLRLLEEGRQVDEILFCDTGLEFPQMYDHLEKLERYIGRPITRLKAPYTFEQYFYEYRAKGDAALVTNRGLSWPSHTCRWCTGRLKAHVIAKHLRGLKRQYHLVASPFDYAKNCLLLFPSRPDAHKVDKPSGEEASHERLARQIEQLVRAAHGHTLVLFTSYDQMGHVYEQLEGRLPVPLFKAPRGGQWFVEQFKRCENAALLAGGPCWEGVDFPGDIVSLLVIVRLPFPVPDPVREARRIQYPDLHSYIRVEIVPEMQQKLRQGFGRAIRTETDSCAAAILDPRAAPGGRYHQAVLDALPSGIPITTKTEDIQTFLRARKSPDFFLPDFENNPNEKQQ